MIQSKLSANVKKLLKQYETNQLSLEYPIQRHENQWSNLSKTALFRSMIIEYPVPPIYLVKNKQTVDGEEVEIYNVLDGKQRLSNVFDFITGGYKTNKYYTDIELNGMKYAFANKNFDKLDKELQSEILTFKFDIVVIEDATEEQISEIFKYLNNGVPLSKSQKAKAEFGFELSDILNKMAKRNFFTEVCQFSTQQLKNAEDQLCIMQAMMLLDNEYDYSSFSGDEILKYAGYLQGNYGLANTINMIVDYLEEVFTEKDKFMKKINIPMVIYLANKAIESEVSAEKFKEWYDLFAATYTPDCEYAQYCGQGSIKKDKVMGRINVMKKDFESLES